MTTLRERRAAALEAIAHALLELAAVEREREGAIALKEVLIDMRNCEAELGLAPRAFTAAAARGDFPAFRVSKRQTATKADVLMWLKSRRIEPKAGRAVPLPKKKAHAGSEAFLMQVQARFVVRVGRPMTDQDLANADTCIDVGRTFAKMTGIEYQDTPDEVVARVVEKIGQEPVYYRDWRSFGLDPARMERDADALRGKLHGEHPEWTWRERHQAVHEMWSSITGPLYEARRKARAEARAAKEAQRVRRCSS